ncbi:MAG TPA: restriction endonuclease, partial [Chitinispirillaceae bacterium]|nr:restriction endonuclease [Chitinispirillaceae bacterium]
MTYVFYKGLAIASTMLAPIVALFLLLTAAISAINSWRKHQQAYLIPPSRKSPASRKSLLNQQVRKSDSLNDRRATGITTSNSLITDIDATDAQTDDLAAIESYYANHAQERTIESKMVKGKADLSIETLKKIEWFSFELFCKIYYECIGYKVTKTKAGADGGIDLLL